MNDTNQENSNQENLPVAPDSNDSTELTGLSAKQATAKEALIEQLRKTPIVQIACEKVGIGRTTFYRWRKEDRQFAEAVEAAINPGADLVSDMAESKLVSLIKEGNMTAVMFWLKNRHKSYATKLEMVNNSKPIIEQLSPEQEAIVQKALELASFSLPEDNPKENLGASGTGDIPQPAESSSSNSSSTEENNLSANNSNVTPGPLNNPTDLGADLDVIPLG